MCMFCFEYILSAVINGLFARETSIGSIETEAKKCAVEVIYLHQRTYPCWFPTLAGQYIMESMDVQEGDGRGKNNLGRIQGCPESSSGHRSHPTTDPFCISPVPF